MIGGEIFAMLGSSAVSATLPTLIAQWRLDSLQAGWLSGAYFIGYAAAVPVLVSLTDRFDARFIFALGCLCGLGANLGFAFAGGLRTAAPLWALAGISLAGVYMPGLRVIIDGIDPGMRLRAVPYYTASFGIGTSLSFLTGGLIAQWAGWPAAFITGGCGCLVALLCLVLATLGANRRVSPSQGSGAFNVRAVLRNHAAMRYILAYGGHCWELFALRAWLVALLFFFWNSTVGGNAGRTITYWSAAITLVGVPSSIIGAEWALRIGRRRLIAIAAGTSIVIAILTGMFGAYAFLGGAIALVLYTTAITGDSAALTTGVVDVSDDATRGSTLALHSLIGFAGGGLGPMAVGAALALGGGVTAWWGWMLALVVMAAGSGVALLAVR